jgi:hypothetical protein
MGNWDVIAATLVQLAEAKPELGIPLCVALFTRVENKPSTQRDPNGMQHDVWTWTGHVLKDTAAGLFGSTQDPSRLTRLQAALAMYEVPGDTPDILKPVLEAAVAWGKQAASSGT